MLRRGRYNRRFGIPVARLAHGWHLEAARDVPSGLIREWLRPAVRAVPGSMAARLGACRIAVCPRLPEEWASSRWRRVAAGLQVDLACQDADPHDVGMELLTCLGQALWEQVAPEAWLRLLEREIQAEVAGEIDEAVLVEKRALLSSRASARSPRRLRRYAAASFAATAAEYVHSIWHDVHVRRGPEHLPAQWLRRRLALFARWFPPDRGQRLFA